MILSNLIILFKKGINMAIPACSKKDLLDRATKMIGENKTDEEISRALYAMNSELAKEMEVPALL